MTDKLAADMANNSIVLKATGDVEIAAAKGEENKLPTFAFHGYTGEPMTVEGFYHPVIVDLAGAELADPMTALMGHDDSISGIVGQGTATKNDAGIFATGTVMAEDPAAQKLLTLSKNGFKWQASIGASIRRREFLDAGKAATVNGRQVAGPLIIARDSLVHEISFVRRGADSNTSAAVAASHSDRKVTVMEPKFAAWLEAKSIDPAAVSENPTLKAYLENQFKAETPRPQSIDQVFAGAEADQVRQQGIATLTARFLGDNSQLGSDGIAKAKLLAEMAVESKWSVDRYELELLRAGRPEFKVFKPQMGSDRLNSRVVEAAICQAGRLSGHEKRFDDQTLQAAHDEFHGRISLKQLFMVCARANGYHDRMSGDLNIEAHRAAFGFSGPTRIQASGFSTLSISTILSNTANKFLMEGWNAVDMTAMRLSSIRPVPDLKTVTTVSLTGDMMFEKLGAAGEIKHGTLGEVTYTNKADTYARMLAITEDDIINDDLGALTAIPRKLGRGAATKLNDIFWTVFLGAENAGFFSATHNTVGNTGNSNFNTGAADITLAGLTATELLFLNQVDPNGLPLGVQPAIMVVPTALKATATALLDPQSRLITGASSTLSDVNVFAGRFRLESSPYMHNSSYTGYSPSAWYMMADPNEMPMIEIAAYQGRVEPTVESASADFNTLGVQMRGVNRVGVALQDFRAAVKADGGSS